MHNRFRSLIVVSVSVLLQIKIASRRVSQHPTRECPSLGSQSVSGVLPRLNPLCHAGIAAGEPTDPCVRSDPKRLCAWWSEKSAPLFIESNLSEAFKDGLLKQGVRRCGSYAFWSPDVILQRFWTNNRAQSLRPACFSGVRPACCNQISYERLLVLTVLSLSQRWYQQLRRGKGDEHR